jgi:AraC family transcriptional regulator, transcriptional activator of the genes for pyochelin and ferripyochelin receptors
MQLADYIDYCQKQALNASQAPTGDTSVRAIYQDSDGIRFRSGDALGESLHETLRLSDRALLLATDFSRPRADFQEQVFPGDDWIHLQFRCSGSGHETVSGSHPIETPEHSCIISRYPRDCVINRQVLKADRWKYVCLIMTPRELTNLLQVPASKLPTTSLWMANEESRAFQFDVIPLQSGMMTALSDILTCTYRDTSRRVFMRAKSLELLSSVIHTLDSRTSAARCSLRISEADFAKIATARTMITQNIGLNLTLAEIARKVGINRTKLVLGFKKAYGTSLQAYWRDLKLVHARQLLRSGNVRVTEIAYIAGYSEVSSFSSAFTRKFGLSPRECRDASPL